MSFRVESCVGSDPRDAHEVARRVAVMSERRFGSDTPFEYFEALLRGHPACLAILAHDGPTSTDIAFSSIVPLRIATARAQMLGKLDEFDLAERDVVDPRTMSTSEPVFLCVQAITLSVDLRALIRALRPKRLEPFMPAFETMVWQQLRDLGLERPFEDVTLYAEVWSEDGQRHVEACGQSPVLDEQNRLVITAQGCPMYAWNSVQAAMAPKESMEHRYYERFREAMGKAKMA